MNVKTVPPSKMLLCTAPSRDEAADIARELIGRRLAACVNILGPVQSVYRWKGEVEEAQEFVLLIKTTVEKAHLAQEAIGELHSYDVPEVIQIPIEGGLPEYLRWVGDAVK